MKEVTLKIVDCVDKNLAAVYVDETLEKEEEHLDTMDWQEIITKYQLFNKKIRRYGIKSDYIKQINGFPKQFSQIEKEQLAEW